MTNLPPAYAWLNAVNPLPKMVAEALKLYGTHEGTGDVDNPVILGWAEETGHPDYEHDSVAWCGLFMDLVAMRAGKNRPAKPLWALNWVNFGATVTAAALGDVLIFDRFDAAGKLIGGHVGLYVAEDDTAYHVLGGNEMDAVSIARLGKNRLHAIRRPVYQIAPDTVKPIRVSSVGALSVNEA